MKKENNKIEIYIAAHKKFNEPEDKLYIPLHVGSEGKDDLGYKKDSTGDNISKKNPNYCELTGIYWIWKNSKADIVGLVHYRRYFYKTVVSNKNKLLDKEDIEKLLSKYDIIVAPKGYTWGSTVRDKYNEMHIKDDLDKCEKILKKKYPDFNYVEFQSTPIMIDYMNNNHLIGISPRSVVKEYLDKKELFEIKNNLKLPNAKMFITYNKKLKNKSILAVCDFFREHSFYDLNK